MPTENPLFSGGWSIKKFNAMVINDIWPQVLLFSLIATMVTLITELKVHNLAINNGLLTVLGTVLGLVISFRTSSAYERYQEGRKMWTSIQIASRNLAQLIWIHVPNERKDKGQTVVHSVIEKKSMVNLTQAFSVAVKHFLRGEAGVYYQDLYPLISFLPRYVNNPDMAKVSSADMAPLWQASEDGEYAYEHGVTSRPGTRSATRTDSDFPAATLVGKPEHKGSWLGSFGSRVGSRRNSFYDPEKALPHVHVHRPLKPARCPPESTIYDYVPFLVIFKPLFSLFHKKKKNDARDFLGRKRKPQLGDSNVPLEITLYLSNYVAYILRSATIPPAVASALVTNVSSLQDTLANLERIGSTPLPFAYQAHLRMSLWIYLALLPFQVVASFHYLTIPGTAFASFLLLGFLEIGQEIENPFNYDLNDLDLDSFCIQIQRELHEITAHTSPDPSEFMFGSWNQPFAPADRRCADEIIAAGENYTAPQNHSVDAGVPSLRATMLRNWREVEEAASHHKARY